MNWFKKPKDAGLSGKKLAECPSCRCQEGVVQTLIHVSHDEGNPCVGAIMRCIECSKLYVTIKGKVSQPKFIRERELAEAQQREHLEAQRAQAKDRVAKGPEPDMRW
jgi:uncharacterized Zn finger protein